jgi:hypothetical protein
MRAKKVELLIVYVVVCANAGSITRSAAPSTVPSILLAADCSGDEALACRLQLEEARAAPGGRAAQYGATSACRDGRQRLLHEIPAPRLREEADHPPLATTLLGEAESRVLCQQLGDRGFEGTGKNNEIACNEHEHNGTMSQNAYPDFLLGSMAKALREGATRIVTLTKTIAEMGSKCVSGMRIVGQIETDDRPDEAHLKVEFEGSAAGSGCAGNLKY